jgi:hypothetical protein
LGIISDIGGNMATYAICGTCSIRCNGTTIKIWLYPSEGYLSSNKDKALFYSTVDETAILRSFIHNEKCVEIDVPAKPPVLLQVVLSATTSQRKIRITVENGTNLKLVGCTFPTP